MSITQDTVRHVAALARLSLHPSEVERLTGELGAIVEYMGQLAELDTADVPPTAHLAVPALPLLPDDVQSSLPSEAALAEAPRTVEGGFGVPAFVET